ncbi:MAG: hypothetical protein L0Y58_03715 [Verrucomicrobia subdivision 3 bacterium]|nr:hypothetical protein [Limisphaerales bacterium]
MSKKWPTVKLAAVLTRVEREENERAWKLPVKDLVSYDANGLLQSVNLDRKNPRGKEDITHLPPEQLAASILQKEQRIAEIMAMSATSSQSKHENNQNEANPKDECASS